MPHVVILYNFIFLLLFDLELHSNTWFFRPSASYTIDFATHLGKAGNACWIAQRPIHQNHLVCLKSSGAPADGGHGRIRPQLALCAMTLVELTQCKHKTQPDAFYSLSRIKKLMCFIINCPVICHNQHLRA